MDTPWKIPILYDTIPFNLPRKIPRLWMHPQSYLHRLLDLKDFTYYEASANLDIFVTHGAPVDIFAQPKCIGILKIWICSGILVLEGTTSTKKICIPPFSRLKIACWLRKSGEHVTVVYQPDRHVVLPGEKEKEILFFGIICSNKKFLFLSEQGEQMSYLAFM